MALPNTLIRIIQLNILAKPVVPSLPNICFVFDKIAYIFEIRELLLSLLTAEINSKDISFRMTINAKTDNKKVIAFTIATSEKF